MKNAIINKNLKKSHYDFGQGNEPSGIASVHKSKVGFLL